MTHHDEHDTTRTAPGRPEEDSRSAEREPRGINTHPPGAGDRDDDAVDKGVDKLGWVEAGH